MNSLSGDGDNQIKDLMGHDIIDMVLEIKVCELQCDGIDDRLP